MSLCCHVRALVRSSEWSFCLLLGQKLTHLTAEKQSKGQLLRVSKISQGPGQCSDIAEWCAPTILLIGSEIVGANVEPKYEAVCPDAKAVFGEPPRDVCFARVSEGHTLTCDRWAERKKQNARAVVNDSRELFTHLSSSRS